MLSEFHAFAAIATATPELILDESKDEHQKLARALARVAEHYDLASYVNVPTHPLFGLARVCLALYVPRYFAMRMRKAAESAKDVTPKNPLAAPPPRPNNPQPVQPQAAQPMPTNEIKTPSPPQPRAMAVVPGGNMTVRAAPIPGFESVPIDIKLN